jgi:hypothetical protein
MPPGSWPYTQRLTRARDRRRHVHVKAGPLMSLKRNLILVAAYVVALTFMALPFTFIEGPVPGVALAQATE